MSLMKKVSAYKTLDDSSLPLYRRVINIRPEVMSSSDFMTSHILSTKEMLFVYFLVLFTGTSYALPRSKYYEI